MKVKNYKEHLLEQHQNPKETAAYLNAALHDDDPHVFLLAFRDIAEAEERVVRYFRTTAADGKNH